MNQQEIEIAALRSALKQAQVRHEEDASRIAELEAQAVAARADPQHYVRNTLAVVRSIARRTAANSESVEDYQDNLDGRISAFARVQSVLMRNPGSGIDLGLLIADELIAFGVGLGKEARLDGAPLRLKPKPAGLLGLAIHELAVNSIKVGALAVGGSIAVAWSVEPNGSEPGLRINWSEAGKVPGADMNEKKQGFGPEVLKEAIAYELSGSAIIDVSSTGLMCRIHLPLECLLN